MALLYNIAADRELQEGDEVTVSKDGRQGTVVAFDLFSDRPIVVQSRTPRGLLREKFAANEVEISTYREAPSALEPLPTIKRILGDVTQTIRPCGKGLSLELKDGTVLTLFPKRENQSLRRIYEAVSHQSLGERVSDLLKLAYVTRLPHFLQL